MKVLLPLSSHCRCDSPEGSYALFCVTTNRFRRYHSARSSENQRDVGKPRRFSSVQFSFPFLRREKESSWVYESKPPVTIPKPTPSSTLLRLIPLNDSEAYVLLEDSSSVSVLFLACGFAATVVSAPDTFVSLAVTHFFGSPSLALQLAHSFYLIRANSILFRIPYFLFEPQTPSIPSSSSTTSSRSGLLSSSATPSPPPSPTRSATPLTQRFSPIVFTDTTPLSPTQLATFSSTS